jgi:hypothetical protein
MKRLKLFAPPCVATVLLYVLVPGFIHAQSVSSRSVDASWSFDGRSDETLRDSLAQNGDHLEGFWRRVPGVKGQALEFDGYTTGIWREAKDVPKLGNAFTVSAWVALNNYPWNWVPIIDQSEHQQVGFFFGIDAFGHVGFSATVDGVWKQVTSDTTLPLKKWAHVTGIFNGDSGLSILVDGKPVANLTAPGVFWQDINATMILGKVRVPQVSFPAWISHPQDPVQYSLDGYLDEVQVLNRSVSQQQEQDDLSQVTNPSGDVIPYAVLPSGQAEPGPFGAMYATLKYSPAWDRLRRIGSASDVVVRFDKSAMRLVFWQGTNYIPAWVTEDGKWYTDEFLETWGPGCGGAGDCEPMSDKQSRYSHVSVLESSDARAVIHWRYALAEARNYEGAHPNVLSGWFDWADEYWTVYPDGVAVRKQVLWSSALEAPHEWQETIVINGPGQRPEDNIEADALTLENMAGEEATYHWEPKTDQTFAYPKGPAKLDQPNNANIQIVHLKSPQNPFQIVWPRKVSFDTYNGEQSYSMFEWWNHWPVAQVGSSGRPAIAPDRASHTSLSHIYWEPYEQSQETETKLLLCGLTRMKAHGLLPLARSWLSPPPIQASGRGVTAAEFDPAQRAFLVHRDEGVPPTAVTVTLDASSDHPLVNPALVVENWSSQVRLLINGKAVTGKDNSGVGFSANEGKATLIVWLKLNATSRTVIELRPAVE